MIFLPVSFSIARVQSEFGKHGRETEQVCPRPFLSSSPSCGSSLCRAHPLVAAPPFSMTSLQTFLKPPARFLATRLAFAERHTPRTRARYAILSSTGRRLTMSARSLRRSSFHNHSYGSAAAPSMQSTIKLEPKWLRMIRIE